MAQDENKEQDNKGWICLYRKIQDCWIWEDKPYSYGQAWTDLLLLANHRDKRVLFNGDLITIKKGQRLTSIRQLGERWGWSRTKVSKFMGLLEADRMITKESDNKKTLITVVNYEVYQNTKDTEKTQKSHRDDTGKTQKDTNNNENNYNNENNENNNTPPYPPTGEWNYNGHSNLENVKHFLNCCEYEGKEYIRENKELWELIKAWMEYKDAKKPKASNHYVNERSLKALLNQFVKNSKKYGVGNVAVVVDETMSKTYNGITWDKLEKGKFGQSGVEAFLKSMEGGDGN